MSWPLPLLLGGLLLSASPGVASDAPPLPFAPGASALGHTPVLVVGVLLLLGGGAWLLRRGFSFRPRGQGERRLQVRESRMLGHRQFVVVVEYDDTRVLLGVTPGKIDFLCDLPGGPEPAAALDPAPVPATPRASALARFSLPLLALLLACGPAAAQVPFGGAPFTFPPPEFPVPSAPLPPPAPGPASPLINLQLGRSDDRQSVASAIQIVGVMTLLTVAPSLIMLMTSFTRLVIVLGFVRTALGVQGAPSNQIIIGISLFLTFFIMAPVGSRINEEALQPYQAGRLSATEALERAATPLQEFMQRQTRPADTEFFLRLAAQGPTTVEHVPLRVVVPAFVISELRTAFQMGFLIFVPFLVIDFLVSSTLMSMGMMMMPPVVVSLPFKLLLFVLVDGWHLVIRSLVESFAV